MKRNQFKIGLLLGLTCFVSVSQAFGADTLTLDAFLSQVKDNHTGIKGYLSQSKGGALRSEEGLNLISPTFYGNFQFTSDAKLNQSSFLTYDSMLSRVYSLGISQVTPFGLEGKIHYDIFSSNYVNPAFPAAFSSFGTGLISLNYNNASPILELTQHLWSNGFGSSTRATQHQLEAQALSSSLNASYMAKMGLSQAEAAYWRLALARQSMAVLSQSVDRAKKIFEWNSKRAHLQLADQSDVLQSEASLQSRELDLLAAQNEEKAASRNFNTARNVDADTVSEKLVELDLQMMNDLKIPVRAEMRDDVKSALHNSKASAAQAEIAMEKDNPTLDIFGSYALNGQPGQGAFQAYQNLSDSMAASFSFNRPTWTLGIRFSVPLDIGILSKSKEGWQLERLAADLNFDRKRFEQDQNWKDLVQNFGDSKKHLELSRKLELLQGNKLEHERDRLHQGRTTTYQVLLFEQDYLLAQLTRIRDQANLLNLIAQMKTFGETL